MNTAKAIIQIHMKTRNVTPAKIAKCFGVTERTWWNWLKNPGDSLTAYRLKVLSEVLDLSGEEVSQIVRES